MGLIVNRENTEMNLEGNDIVISDGHHTIDELYEHRIILFITLCKLLAGYLDHLRKEGKVYVSENNPVVWRSKIHNDGSSFDGWFIMGIQHGTQITYHIPLSKWEETNFAETLEKAPEWDGHTSDDVLKRLKQL